MAAYSCYPAPARACHCTPPAWRRGGRAFSSETGGIVAWRSRGCRRANGAADCWHNSLPSVRVANHDSGIACGRMGYRASAAVADRSAPDGGNVDQGLGCLFCKSGGAIFASISNAALLLLFVLLLTLNFKALLG